ncbi:AraC-like DNA-binding protein [Paenibacillus sp. V4I5]|nr:AraC-like DNA-binding protein [Paenibacillus sp. V4I5]
MVPVSGHEYSLLLLSSIRKRRYQKRNILQTRHIPGDMLFVVTQGNGHLCIDKQAFQIYPRQSYFLTQGMSIEVMSESELIEFYIMIIKRVTISKRKGGWSLSNEGASPSLLQTGRIQLKNAKQMLEVVEQLYEESRKKWVDDTDLQLKFQSLIHCIVHDQSDQGEKEEASKGIDQSIGYMLKHFRHKIKLETLSDIAGLTPTSYSRSFKKTKRMSPVEYLNHIRIDSSKQLLQQQEFSIKDVSTSVGFGNEFYFSRTFKNTVGISPTMYVKRRQLKIAVASCFRYKDCLHSLGVDAPFEMNGYRHLELGVEENKRLIQVQLTELRKYRPDLIIADYRHLPFYEQLKQISPTVIINFTMDWRINYMRIAELVGREEEARQNCSQLELRVKYARNLLTQTIGNRTVSIIRLYSGKIRVQGLVDHPLSNLLYSELGLKPGSCVPLNERTKEFALGSLPPFETDYLFIYKHPIQSEETDIFSGVLKGTSWNAMKAVRNNQTRMIPNWISMSWAPIGQNQIIDDLLEWKA